MQRIRWWIVGMVPLLALGCQGVDRAADREIAAETMPRPAVILVSDFAITPEAVTSGLGGHTRLVQDTPRSATERAVGHRFASAFAANLVEEIRAMGLPAERAGAPVPPGGAILSIEGQFVSIASDEPTAPGIVGFAAGWPNVVADIQIYSKSDAGDRLTEDLEFNLADAKLPPEHLPPGVLAKLPAGTAQTGALPASTQAELDQAAKATAHAAARQLQTFFADRGWIAHAAHS
jgi:hypothetical protein